MHCGSPLLDDTVPLAHIQLKLGRVNKGFLLIGKPVRLPQIEKISQRLPSEAALLVTPSEATFHRQFPEQSRDEMQALRQTFERLTGGQCRMSREVFAEVLSGWRDDKAASKFWTKGGMFFEDLFDQCDADHDGTVDFAEFFSMICPLFAGTMPAKLGAIFNSYLDSELRTVS